MSSDSSSVHDFSPYSGAHDGSATPGVEIVAGHMLPPPPPPPTPPPPPPRLERRPDVIAAIPCAPPPAIAPAPVESPDDPSQGDSLLRLPWTLLLAFVRWYREDGFWYVTSAVAHAVGLISLALISLAIPRSALLIDQNAPSFDAPDAPETAVPPVAHFDTGKAPLEPSALDADSLAMFKDLPVGADRKVYIDDSPEYEAAGGGAPIDTKGQALGGLGGFSVKGVGPGGLGGVGAGVGDWQSARLGRQWHWDRRTRHGTS